MCGLEQHVNDFSLMFELLSGFEKRVSEVVDVVVEKVSGESVTNSQDDLAVSQLGRSERGFPCKGCRAHGVVVSS